jgi:hypothetical protein
VYITVAAEYWNRGADGGSGSGVSGDTYGGGASSPDAGRYWDPYGDVNGSFQIASYNTTGGVGAVRIMWGGGRSYPSNAADV